MMENSIFNGNIMGISLSWGPQTAKLTHICLRELLGFNGKTLIRWGYDGGRMGMVIPITLHCTLKKIEKCMKLGVFTVLSMAVPINPTCCWRIFQISIQQCQASLVMMGILLGLMVFW